MIVQQFNLTGKTACITGGTHGLGMALAKALDGAIVSLATRARVPVNRLYCMWTGKFWLLSQNRIERGRSFLFFR